MNAWEKIRSAADCLVNTFDGSVYNQLNERYLHHAFSSLVKHEMGLDYRGYDRDGKLWLHPEWPTFKKIAGLGLAKYRKTEGDGYRPCEITSRQHRGGLIDFAVGEYVRPIIGIEFSFAIGWKRPIVEFDLLKLFDNRTPFECVLSLNFVLRPNGFAGGGGLVKFEAGIQNAAKNASSRLADMKYTADRPCHRADIRIIEVHNDKNRQWVLDSSRWHFVRRNW